MFMWFSFAETNLSADCYMPWEIYDLYDFESRKTLCLNRLLEAMATTSGVNQGCHCHPLFPSAFRVLALSLSMRFLQCLSSPLHFLQCECLFAFSAMSALCVMPDPVRFLPCIFCQICSSMLSGH